MALREVYCSALITLHLYDRLGSTIQFSRVINTVVLLLLLYPDAFERVLLRL